MEDDVDALRDPAHRVDVADVAFDEVELAALGNQFEVGAATTDEVVEDHDLGDILGEELVGDRRTDEAAAAGDEDPLALQ